jgi:hypothetical protein
MSIAGFWRDYHNVRLIENSYFDFDYDSTRMSLPKLVCKTTMVKNEIIPDHMSVGKFNILDIGPKTC